MDKALKAAAAFAVWATCGSTAFAGSDYDAARRASTFMAAADICKTPISDAQKRTLFAKILSVFETPSQVKYQIDKERSTLKRLSPSDRDAMCLAIGDLAKTIDQ